MAVPGSPSRSRSRVASVPAPRRPSGRWTSRWCRGTTSSWSTPASSPTSLCVLDWLERRGSRGRPDQATGLTARTEVVDLRIPALEWPWRPCRYRRRGLIAVCVANGIEWYDFAVYGALASVTVVRAAAAGSRHQSRLVTVFAVSATSFARPPARVPCSSAASGPVRTAPRHGGDGPADERRDRGDRAAARPGRQRAPSPRRAWSLLRLVQGFASGGEISTSIPFLLESAPAERWGFYGGWHTATVALGHRVRHRRGRRTGRAPADGGDGGLGLAGPVPARAAARSGRALRATAPRRDPGIRAATASEARAPCGEVWRDHGTAVRTGFVLVGVLAGHLQHVVRLPARPPGRRGRPSAARWAWAARRPGWSWPRWPRRCGGTCPTGSVDGHCSSPATLGRVPARRPAVRSQRRMAPG